MDRVIRALPLIARRVPDVRYVVIGEGDDRARLESLAEECAVRERVEFRGRVGESELARAYADCALFVMPSSREGFGIVYLEAARFGKASVADSRGAAPEVVLDGETGRVVDSDDKAALASAIAELLENDAERRRLGENARRRLEENFTYEAFRKRLEEILAGGAAVVSDRGSAFDALTPVSAEYAVPAKAGISNLSPASGHPSPQCGEGTGEG